MAQFTYPFFWNDETGAAEQPRLPYAGTVAAPGTYSATVVSRTLTNYGFRGIMVHTNITRLPGSASTTWATKIKAIDKLADGTWNGTDSGTAITIASGPARSASGAAVLICYPGASETAGALARVSCPLPRNFGIIVSLSAGAANATSCLLSLSYQFLA